MRLILVNCLFKNMNSTCCFSTFISVLLLVALSFFQGVWKMGLFPKSWGEYPPEYNREVHGPYNPSVYYGKRDTPFTEVKLGELMQWLSRRNKSPGAMARAFGRAFFRYQLNWVQVKKPNASFLYQFVGFLTIFGFWYDYKRNTAEKRHRYH